MKKNEPYVPVFSASDLTPFPKSDAKRPLVFMFQPTHYKPVSTPKELKLWEKTMREDVGAGANSPLLNNVKGKDGSLTLSYSCWNGTSDLTDCDEL